jgi:hypothetical protein
MILAGLCGKALISIPLRTEFYAARKKYSQLTYALQPALRLFRGGSLF